LSNVDGIGVLIMAGARVRVSLFLVASTKALHYKLFSLRPY